MSDSFVTLWTVARQAPLSMGFSRQEYWSGFPFPPPKDLPSPGTEPASLALQGDSLPLRHLGRPYINYTVDLIAATRTRYGAQVMCVWAVWASLATHPLPLHPTRRDLPGPDMAALHTRAVDLPSAKGQVWGEVDEFPPPPLI